MSSWINENSINFFNNLLWIGISIGRNYVQFFFLEITWEIKWKSAVIVECNENVLHWTYFYSVHSRHTNVKYIRVAVDSIKCWTWCRGVMHYNRFRVALLYIGCIRFQFYDNTKHTREFYALIGFYIEFTPKMKSFLSIIKERFYGTSNTDICFFVSSATNRGM